MKKKVIFLIVDVLIVTSEIREDNIFFPNTHVTEVFNTITYFNHLSGKIVNIKQ